MQIELTAQARVLIGQTFMCSILFGVYVLLYALAHEKSLVLKLDLLRVAIIQ